MVELMRAEGHAARTFELDTRHCPNLTIKREAVDIVTRGAAGQTYRVDGIGALKTPAVSFCMAIDVYSASVFSDTTPKV